MGQNRGGPVGTGGWPGPLLSILYLLAFLLSEMGSHWRSISRRVHASSPTYFNGSIRAAMGIYDKSSVRLEISVLQ